MRVLVPGGLFLAALAVWLSSRTPTGGPAATPPPVAAEDGGKPGAVESELATASEVAVESAHTAPAVECATGCAVGNHPIEPLSVDDYRAALAELAEGSSVDRARALETLLFHGARTRELIARLGTGGLDEEDVALLRRELSRTHARLSLRLVDESGSVRARIDEARFPLGVKEHVHATETADLPAPEVSGTVHRTAPHHLWTRL